MRYLRNVMGLWLLEESLRIWRSRGQPTDLAALLDAAARAPALVRCVLDSLALAHRAAVRQVQDLTGRHVDVIHLVGGGARNALLCQLTADACQLPVVAGPVEATALGNALVRARTLGAVGPDLPAMRALVRRTQPLRRYRPSGDGAGWRAAAARLAVRP